MNTSAFARRTRAIALGGIFLASCIDSFAVFPQDVWTLTEGKSKPEVAKSDGRGNFVVSMWGDGCSKLAKYSGMTGAVLWMRCAPLANDLAVDPDGNLLAVTENQVAKYSGNDGSVVWQASYAPESAGMGIGSDPQGDVIVATYYGIFKLSGGDGHRVWTMGHELSPGRLAVDSQGNAIVGGAFVSGGGPVTEVRKHSAIDGGLLWSKRFEGTSNRFPQGLIVDPNDDVVATGGLEVRGVPDRAFSTLKLASSDGTVGWIRSVEGASGDDYGVSVSQDVDGTIVATGRVGDDMATIKYSSDGEILWRATYHGLLGGRHAGWNVAFDAIGDVYTIGDIGTDSHDRTDIRTIKYRGSDGHEIWSVGHNGGQWPGPADLSIAVVPVEGGVVAFGDAEPGFIARKYSSDPGEQQNYHGLWWRSPPGSGSGWGINVAHHGDILFATWFTYLEGKPAWWVMPRAENVFDHTFYGAIYRTTGPPLALTSFDPALVKAEKIGNAFLDFSDKDNAVFRWDTDLQHVIVPMTRQIFDVHVPTCTAGGEPGERPNYQDLWWARPAGSESGWGINFTHQGDIIFATWFTYGATGESTWLVASDLRRTPDSTYDGLLYRTELLASGDYRVTEAGRMTVSFEDPYNGLMTYTVDGRQGSKAITREVFALPATMCR